MVLSCSHISRDLSFKDEVFFKHRLFESRPVIGVSKGTSSRAHNRRHFAACALLSVGLTVRRIRLCRSDGQMHFLLGCGFGLLILIAFITAFHNAKRMEAILSHMVSRHPLPKPSGIFPTCLNHCYWL